jgi:hypothetical protein
VFREIAANSNGIVTNSPVHDKTALNMLRPRLRWTLMPHEFVWTIGHVRWEKWDGDVTLLRASDIPPSIRAHHANYTIGIENKLKLLAFVREAMKTRGLA